MSYFIYFLIFILAGVTWSRVLESIIITEVNINGYENVHFALSLKWRPSNVQYPGSLCHTRSDSLCHTLTLSSCHTLVLQQFLSHNVEQLDQLIVVAMGEDFL